MAQRAPIGQKIGFTSVEYTVDQFKIFLLFLVSELKQITVNFLRKNKMINLRSISKTEFRFGPPHFFPLSYVRMKNKHKKYPQDKN